VPRPGDATGHQTFPITTQDTSLKHQPSRNAAAVPFDLKSVTQPQQKTDPLNRRMRRTCEKSGLARMIYMSLCGLRLLTIPGWAKGMARIMAGHANRVVRPRLKLH